MEDLIRESHLTTPLSELPGIGARKSSLFAKLGIFSLQDLITYYPRDYKDTVTFYSFRQLLSINQGAGVATVVKKEQVQTHNGPLTVITAQDENGDLCQFPLFNRGFWGNAFPLQRKFYFYGKIQNANGHLQGTLVDFEQYSENPRFFKRYLPIYPLTAGLSLSFIMKTMENALKRSRTLLFFHPATGWRPPIELMNYPDAIEAIHFPSSWEELQKAKETLGILELYRFAVGSFQQRRQRLKKKPLRESVGLSGLSPLQKKIIHNLPFSLTAGQQKALEEINNDLNRPLAMERLLQGDVGCGKTLVAFLTAARIMERGKQCALMVPTELLARQHAQKAFELFSPLGKTVAFYAGSLKKENRESLLKALREGSIDFIIGTHALFGESVAFRNLGLVIIDEQHKFGVSQRERLAAKGEQADLLMMSATPIPRTLAHSLYFSLEVSTIDDLPGGRLPIKTHIARMGNESKVYNFVFDELQKGHQAYFVYPLIEENSSSHLKDSLQMAEALQMQVFPNFKVALIHSRLREEQKNEIMERFAKNEIHILVATTVVEVGIDNPNATVMVIENAQQFGLSTLHQLRGRIGRSSLPSYCFLIYNQQQLTDDGKARLKILTETQDGFRIAHEDLLIRGPGEIFGSRQSGTLRFKLANPLKEKDTLEAIYAQLQALYPD